MGTWTYRPWSRKAMKRSWIWPNWVILKDDGWNLMSSKDRIEALEAGAGVVETRT